MLIARHIHDMVSVDASFPSAFPAHGREAREASDVGRRIADRYQIERVSHEDQLTTTVIARHLSLEERVTVQVLRPEQRFDTQRSAQYLDAIKALARIKTDHVVRVLDVGIALYLGPFLVLEELEGNTLAQLLRASCTGGCTPAACCWPGGASSRRSR
jgi:serine/threonine protein kinase